ncbi:MAG TPA: VCBS repeat-containing protein, partial [Rhodocyclaceae bacterium]|nr:VCBS repeat-containing protein [Rhodocyclaceae bacterium]
DFQIAFSLQRETLTETSVSLRLGEAAKQKDPLVVNFSGNAAQLDSTAFAFDLDGDGTVEHLAAPVAGSGFLAIDRNGNGTIDHGGELFGPASGDGFSELAALDADGNAWIDENDPQFAQLRYWNPLADPEGKGLSLSQAGIGALSLSPVATPFDLYGSNASLLGSLRSTGIALRESGEAGTISHIDLTA